MTLDDLDDLDALIEALEPHFTTTPVTGPARAAAPETNTCTVGCTWGACPDTDACTSYCTWTCTHGC